MASERPDRSPPALARTFYRLLDEKAYDGLRDLLHPDFVQIRPDMRLDGRESYLSFMQEGRPRRDTTHRIEAVFSAQSDAVAVQGKVLTSDETVITGFVDVFAFEDDRIWRLETYTDQHPTD